MLQVATRDVSVCVSIKRLVLLVIEGSVGAWVVTVILGNCAQ